MNKKFNVAVVGATGAVGETIFKILEQRNFPINNLYPLASLGQQGNILLSPTRPDIQL